MSGTRCCVVSDARFARRGGEYWDPRNNFPQGHWQEMLSVFDEVVIFARAREADTDPPRESVLPKGATVREAPYYVGALAIALTFPALLRSVWRLTREDMVFLLRGPGFLSMIVAFALRLRRKPYCVELLGDSGEALMFSSLPMRAFWATMARMLTRAVASRASAALYVVGFLADRYPVSRQAASAVISDAKLPASMFRDTHPAPSGVLSLVMVANMEQPYKGHTYLFDALALLRERGIEVRLRLVGDGRYRPQLEQHAASLGISEQIEFHGALPWGDAVFSIMDGSDLFILTSLTEGMPKALLEAMARGLPAIATRVGGMPEVLPERALFPPADARAIAAKVQQFHEDRSDLARLAVEGRAVAETFREELLSAKRRAFYSALKSLS